MTTLRWARPRSARDLGGEPIPGVAGQALRADLDDHPPATPSACARALLVRAGRRAASPLPASAAAALARSRLCAKLVAATSSNAASRRRSR